MATNYPSADEPVIIHMWCGPRSLSTATMYSFAQRPDTSVVDEPLYPYWLNNHPEIFRPYRKELLEKGNTDGNAVLRDIATKLAPGKSILFLKHISKFAVGIDRRLLYAPNAKHVFLVRDPLEMIMSWGEKSSVHQDTEECSLESMGLPVLVDLYSCIRRHTGVTPVVADSNMLRDEPEAVLRSLCDRLSIPFYPEQLQWPAGPKPDIDGLWAPHWYDKLHKSTGFYTSKKTIAASKGEGRSKDQSAKYYPALSAEQRLLYREVLPFYEILRSNALGVDPLNPGSSVVLPIGSSSSSSSNSKNGSGNDSVIDHGIKMHLGTTATPAATATGSGTGSVTQHDLSLSRLSDPRNANLLVWVGDRLLPRDLAKISVFDSTVQGGDACWEGMRVYKGKVFQLDAHVNRMLDSAQSLAFENVPSRSFIIEAILKTLSANGMTDGAHMRVTLSRGPKLTSSMNPQFNVFGTCLIVLAEWKPVGDMATYDNQKGIKLITATNRRNPPQCVDSKIHHNNLINNILPKIQANYAGAADALMLDMNGFVSETNATNVFMIKNGSVLTPTADACLPGITRRVVMQIVASLGIPLVERNISLAEFHSADEVFTTGTMGELTPVYQIDGRHITNRSLRDDDDNNNEDDESDNADDHRNNRPITKRIQEAYTELTESSGYPLPF
mmetsp:Transcript_10578/g.17246  ORF Transcript_10578/g.17246 Transcript_10578/m.17246 type:complete len:670 (-) Transcript_10578:128-2137(-)